MIAKTGYLRLENQLGGNVWRIRTACRADMAGRGLTVPRKTGWGWGWGEGLPSFQRNPTTTAADGDCIKSRAFRGIMEWSSKWTRHSRRAAAGEGGSSALWMQIFEPAGAEVRSKWPIEVGCCLKQNVVNSNN